MISRLMYKSRNMKVKLNMQTWNHKYNFEDYGHVNATSYVLIVCIVLGIIETDATPILKVFLKPNIS